MNVQETIDVLSKISDKSLRVLFDCQHCGHGLELVGADECVVIETREAKRGDGNSE